MAGKHSKKTQKNVDKKIEKNKSEQKVKESKKTNPINGIMKIILILFIILIIIICGGYLFLNSKLDKIQQININKDNLNVSSNISGYKNIALFGVDSKNNSLGKENHSDSIIIASINEETKDIKLISVYRDTYVQIDDHGLDKINHAYSYGGAELAIRTLNTNLDLNITDFLAINYDALENAIDNLGGIDINVTYEELPYINQYIAVELGNENKTETNVTNAGLHTLNGVQTIAYSRIRRNEGGSFSGTDRMINVLQSILLKLKSKNIFELNNFVNNVFPNIYTNISKSKILSVLPNFSKYNVLESKGWPNNAKGITLDKWYSVPVTLETNVKSLHEELFKEPYIVSNSIKEISDKIISETGYNQ